MSFAASIFEACADIDTAISASALVFASGIGITSAELFQMRRSLWRPHGLLDWLPAASDLPANTRPAFHPWMTWASRPGLVDVIIAARILAALALFICILSATSPFLPLLVIGTTQLFYNWRLKLLLDGSDKVATLVGLSLLLAATFPHEPPVRAAVLWFLGAQLTLSYTYAGIIKAIAPKWWSGEVLRSVLATTVFGDPAASRCVERWPMVAQLASWGTIFVESTFLIALLGPAEVALIYLVSMALFHLGVATFMGLNAFLFFFLSLYPAFCFTWVGIRELLHGS